MAQLHHWPRYPQMTMKTRYNTYGDIPYPVKIAVARALRAQNEITPPPSKDDLVEFWGLAPEWLDQMLAEITPEMSAKSRVRMTIKGV